MAAERYLIKGFQPVASKTQQAAKKIPSGKPQMVPLPGDLRRLILLYVPVPRYREWAQLGAVEGRAEPLQVLALKVGLPLKEFAQTNLPPFWRYAELVALLGTDQDPGLWSSEFLRPSALESSP